METTTQETSNELAHEAALSTGVAMPKKRGRPRKWAKVELDAEGKPVQAEKKTKREMTDEEILALVKDRFDAMADLTHGMVAGINRALIVSGAPGVGKTHTLRAILDEAKEKHGTVSEFVSGTVTAVNLFRLLFKMRAPNCITVFDDTDGMFLDENAMNILKAATDTGKRRRLSYMSDTFETSAKNEDEAEELGDVPPQYDFEGSIIFISNLDFHAYLKAGTNKYTRHMQALLNRAKYLDLRIHARRDLAIWIGHILRTAEMFRVDQKLTDEQVAEILEFLARNQTEVRSLSIRSAIHVADCMKMKPQGWRRLAEVTLLRESR